MRSVSPATRDGAGRSQRLGADGATCSTGRMSAVGSWLVEGIGEDFVPDNLRPVAGVGGLDDRRTPRASPPRAICCGRRASWRDRRRARCVGGRAALLPGADDAAAGRDASSATAATSTSRRCSTTTGCSTRASSSGRQQRRPARLHHAGATPIARPSPSVPDDTLVTRLRAHEALRHLAAAGAARRQGRGHRRRDRISCSPSTTTRTSSRRRSRMP